MISTFDMIAALLTLSATLGWLNRRFVHLPHSIGLLVLGLLASLVLVIAQKVFPNKQFTDQMTDALRQIDFTDVVMNGMLAFLLFAGALGLNLQELRDRALPVGILALLGTILSTGIVGLAFWAAAHAVGHPIALSWALVFGALISPTDPVAVLGALKRVRIPPALEIEMQGEALFNDGVGVVLFTLLLSFAAHGDAAPIGAATVFREFMQEAGGGLALGLATGYMAYRAMRSVDDFPVEVLITLALVAGTYAIAQKLGASGPLAVVAAGLLIADRAPRDAMSDTTQMYVSAFWVLVDEILNSVLFLLIGLEVALLNVALPSLLLGAATIPIVLVARLVSVSVPVLCLPMCKELSLRTIPFLTWAGVRGGISIALALSLPDSAAKSPILAATYAVVLFTIIVQGATLGAVARKTLRDPKPTATDADDGDVLPQRA